MRRLVLLAGVQLLAWCVLATSAEAYDRYSVNRDGTNCRACHGNFRAAPYTSLKDGQNWGDDLHDLHRQTMLSGDCNTCHGSNMFPVMIRSSTGGTGLPAIACQGCHGRAQDTNSGAGLRQHHWRAGETVCANCHADANPANYTPVGEDIRPPYYNTSLANHPNMPLHPCNSAGSEDFAGATTGLDNDGDLSFDMADSQCAANVDLIDFSAEWVAQGVLLAWLTGSEFDCGAFGILRCDPSTDDCAELADYQELAGISVPCEDSPAGAGYEAIDDTAEAGTRYTYYLREYETTGGIRDYGPIVVEVSDPDQGQDPYVPPPDGSSMGDDGGDQLQGCAVPAGRGGGGAATFLLLVLGTLIIIRRRKQS